MANSNLNTCAVVLLGQGEQLRILLVKRRFPPFANTWALPSGFLKAKETALEACCREVLKETGVRLEKHSGHQLTPRKKSDRDPRGEVESTPFFFHIAEDSQLHFDQHTPAGSLGRAGEGIRDCQWFPIEKVPALAFDHGAILCEVLGLFWPTFPTVSSLDPITAIHLPYIFGPKKIDFTKELAFYGGSFNPWHEGHDACLSVSGAEQIIVVPDSSPWKQGAVFQGCRFQSYLSLANKLKDKHIPVYPGYWGMEDGNPTFKWLSGLKLKVNSNVPLALVMGLDTYQNILTWSQAKELIMLLSKIYVVRRAIDLTDKPEDPTQKIQSHNPKLSVIFSQPHEHEKISSSEIRNS